MTLTVSVVLVFMLLFQFISCGCKQSYMTICESFEDIKDNVYTSDWSELVIGSDKSVANESVHLMEVLNFGKFRKLTALFVINKINNLELTYPYQCSYKAANLKLLSFYGNNFEQIEPYHFPVVNATKLSLVNNRIKSIKNEALEYQLVEIFDASDNLLEDIEKYALPSLEVTKEINLRKNKIQYIKPGSFTTSLKILYLDNNNLRYLQEGVLNNLNNLRELGLSHNKFTVLPNIQQLKELAVFNFSSNLLGDVNAQMFAPLPNLKLIELSRNQIADLNALRFLFGSKTERTLTVSLAWNYLRSLNLSGLSLAKKTLILYGNPWDCETWDRMQSVVSKQQTDCDLQRFSSGRTPYCINYTSEYKIFSSKLWEGVVDRFQGAIKNDSEMIYCHLAPDKYDVMDELIQKCVA